MITCPVCRNKCSDNATECDRCGFKELQVTFINEDEANYWAEHTLKPYVVQWENKIRNTSEPEPDGDQDDLVNTNVNADVTSSAVSVVTNHTHNDVNEAEKNEIEAEVPPSPRNKERKKTERRSRLPIIIPCAILAIAAIILAVFLTKQETTALSTAFFDSAKQGDTFLLGVYEQDNNLDNGAEDIEWTVVRNQNDLILAVSTYCLDNMAYNDSESYEATDWANCTLRQWLNGEFYNSAFTDDEKKWICATNLQNQDSPFYQVAGGYNTIDNVFLLGGSDIVANYEDYDFALVSMGWEDVDGKLELTTSTPENYEPLQARYTEYAKETYIQAQIEAWNGNKSEDEIRAQYKELEDRDGDGTCHWWIRLPGDNYYSTMLITGSGVALSNPSQSGMNGVRPAILISKNSAALPESSDDAANDALENEIGSVVDGTLQGEGNDTTSATQLLFREQEVLCVLGDGRVLKAAHEGNELFDWTNIEKVVAADNIVVGLTTDGKVLLSPEGKEVYGVDTLPYENVVDVCICPEAINSDAEKRGCIISLTSDGTAYFVYADGSELYQDNVRSISSYDNKYAFAMNDGTVHGQKYDEAGWGYGEVLEWTNILQIVCGENFIAGLKEDGSVVVSGGCLPYALRDSNYITNNDVGLGLSGIEIETDDWTGIVLISAGRNHLVGIRNDGTVVSAGLNNYNQCDTEDWTNVVSVEASNNTTVGHCSDGTVYIAGKDIMSNIVELQDKFTARLWYSR